MEVLKKLIDKVIIKVKSKYKEGYDK